MPATGVGTETAGERVPASIEKTHRELGKQLSPEQAKAVSAVYPGFQVLKACSGRFSGTERNELVLGVWKPVDSKDWWKREVHRVGLIWKGAGWEAHLVIASQKQDYARCIDTASKAIALKAGYAEALANRGACYSGKGSYPKALRDLDEAILLEPRKAAILLNRGGVRAALGKCASAKSDIAKAVSLDPGLEETAKQFLGSCSGGN